MMYKAVSTILLFIFCLGIFLPILVNPNSAEARKGPPRSCNSGFPKPAVLSVEYPDNPPIGQPFSATITFSSDPQAIEPFFNYYLVVTTNELLPPLRNRADSDPIPGDQIINGTKTITFTTKSGLSRLNETYSVKLMHSETTGETEVCDLGTVKLGDPILGQTQCSISMPSNIRNGDPVDINLAVSSVPNVEYDFVIVTRDYYQRMKKGTYEGGDYHNRSQAVNKSDAPIFRYPGDVEVAIERIPPPGATVRLENRIPEPDLTVDPFPARPPTKRLNNGSYYAVIIAYRPSNTPGFPDHLVYTNPCGSAFLFTVSTNPTTQPVTPAPRPSGPGAPVGSPAGASGQVCQNAGDGIETAIGCIPTDPVSFVKGLVKYSTFVGGGVALLLMIFGAFRMITSSGNPEALKNGQDTFRAAIIGLLFVLFVIVLMQIIGVDILNIPGIRR